MNENKIIETLKYISQFVENRHDEGLGDYLHIVIGRADINVIDETIYLLERKQKEIVRYKEEIEELKQIDRHITKETIEFVNSHYISKGEIKEKIKEYQEKAEDVKQKYKGVYAYKSDYLEALAKIEGYQELLEE